MQRWFGERTKCCLATDCREAVEDSSSGPERALGTLSKELARNSEMKKFLLATTGLLALVGSAPVFAADMAARPRPYTKAPPAMVSTVNEWTGFYVGFNAGGGSSRDRWN